MEIIKSAAAGTLESCDLLVTIEPAESGVDVDIISGVLRQFGRRVREVTLETLSRLDVAAAKVAIVDHGALDCTIRARVECAVFRASGRSGDIPWGGAVRE